MIGFPKARFTGLLLASILGGVTATLLTGSLKAAAVPRLIQAQSFELLDGNGKVRARLQTDNRVGSIAI